MDLTASEVTQQKALLAAVRATFNGNVSAPMNTLRDQLNAAKRTAEVSDCIVAFNGVVDALNAAIAPVRAAIAATDAMPSDAPAVAFREGYFDTCSATGACNGWAAPPGCVVTFAVDGTDVGTAIANQPRADLAAKGDCAWTFQIPANIDKDRLRVITARVGGTFLSNSPKSYGSAPYVPPPVPVPFTRFAPDLSSDAAIQAVFNHANAFYNPGPSLPTVNNPSVWIDGLLQVPIDPVLNLTTGCSWHWWIPQPCPDELWCEYDFYIEPDVLVGFNELGCKLPGLGGEWDQAGQWNDGHDSTAGQGFSARLWHRQPNAAGEMEFASYVYSAKSFESGNSYGDIYPTGKMLKTGVRYKLGQHIKLNTRNADGTWNSDGIYEALLDRQVVYRDAAYKWRTDVRASFNDFFANIYHGGITPVKSLIHYRFGNVIVDSKPILDPSTAARTWQEVPNTKLIEVALPPGYTEPGHGLGAAMEAWCGAGFLDGKFYMAAPGGHFDSANNGHYRVDAKNGGVKMLMSPSLYTPADMAAWRANYAAQGVAVEGYDGFIPGSDTWKDGKPVSMHLYGNIEAVPGLGVLMSGKHRTWLYSLTDDVLPRDVDRAFGWAAGGQFYHVPDLNAVLHYGNAIEPGQTGTDYFGYRFFDIPTLKWQPAKMVPLGSNGEHTLVGHTVLYKANAENQWATMDIVSGQGQWLALSESFDPPFGMAGDPARGVAYALLRDGRVVSINVTSGLVTTIAPSYPTITATGVFNRLRVWNNKLVLWGKPENNVATLDLA